MYKVVDLFAGAGGLSLGFLNTGKFEIKVAIENNKNAQKTYKRNHEEVIMYGDIQDVPFEKFESMYGKIDVVIGGPPCQGFSNANRQKNHLISNNNKLVKEYVRAVEILKPNIFVMENVGMLKSETHRFYCKINERQKLETLNINSSHHRILLISNTTDGGFLERIQNDLINIEDNLLDDDVYYFIKTLHKLVNNPDKFYNKSIKFINKFIKLSEIISINENIDIVVREKWEGIFRLMSKYYEDKIINSNIKHILDQVVMIQKMLITLTELRENEIEYEIEIDELYGLYIHMDSYSVWDYIEKSLKQPSNGYKIASGILNAADFGAPQKRNRFIAIGVKEKYLGTKDLLLPEGQFAETKNYRTVYDAIGDLENYQPVEDLTLDPIKYIDVSREPDNPLKALRNSSELYNHIITRSRDVALERFKVLRQGENFHDLSEDLKNNTYTDSRRTQNTIYMKLKYDEPSGTVLNVRKSMWVHPVHPRALSIREAARLQTFPDKFIFEGTKDSQYQQVGNAVPPILSEAIAKHLLGILMPSE